MFPSNVTITCSHGNVSCGCVPMRLRDGELTCEGKVFITEAPPTECLPGTAEPMTATDVPHTMTEVMTTTEAPPTAMTTTKAPPSTTEATEAPPTITEAMTTTEAPPTTTEAMTIITDAEATPSESELSMSFVGDGCPC